MRFLLGEDCHLPIKRIWGRKSVDRHIFRIESENGTHSWFECNEQLATDILNNIETFVIENHVDRKKLNKLDIIVSRMADGKDIVTISDRHAPKVGMFTRMIRWLKRLK